MAAMMGIIVMTLQLLLGEKVFVATLAVIMPGTLNVVLDESPSSGKVFVTTVADIVFIAIRLMLLQLVFGIEDLRGES
ncbi:hypothetical protein PHLCEN_2v7911 [Hermanssonia centrifuga]|uniref:Uncharacterized protein n=1 Tax=Hermanssonia centrifuga TaxID=98765 RepID=A0A2R6NVC2_9APHY|nr:hypothetical protein PHLCEN_2v7911 [Hermanssonia centrifuga]